jgi:DNA invertase Pin-like site-specific DNA recombinase
VYTRKSSEEGLEQDFNSLQAQREACEAFIKSQRGEGWRLIPNAYDDGGISGGTMERPALRKLLADIEAGTIDVVVVYKVDRLTRSLHDFSKMVEVFDRHGVSFVAVTQQFNTTTSMGRLTLNVLLSFAQFEREVTAERIRDKIAASKRKGIWMGGVVPRGYRVQDRKLLVVPEEAKVVNGIYRRYLECSGMRELAQCLRREGITSKPRKGKAGGPISRGALYALLRSPIYIGMVAHRGEHFPGNHEAIVDRKVWDAAQEKRQRGAAYRGRSRKTDVSPLQGKIFDEDGGLLTTAHTTKNGRRYRYYISHPDDCDREKHRNWRLPAAEFETRVAETIRTILADRVAVTQAVLAADLSTRGVEEILDQLPNSSAVEHFAWLQRVQLGPDQIVVTLALPGKKAIKLERVVPMALKRRGIERRVVIEGQVRSPSRPDARMIKALSLGLRFWERVCEDPSTNARTFAKAERVDGRYLGRALQLAFLVPQIAEAIAAGDQPVTLTATALVHLRALPPSWKEQRAAIGVA